MTEHDIRRAAALSAHFRAAYKQLSEMAAEWAQRADEAAGTGVPSGVYRAGAIQACASELQAYLDTWVVHDGTDDPKTAAALRARLKP